MFTAFRSFTASQGASASRRAGFSSRSAVLLALAVCSLPFGLSLTGCTGSSTVSPSTVTGTSTKPLPSTTAGPTGTAGATGTTGTTPATSSGGIDLTFSAPSGTNVDTSAIHTTALGGLGIGSFNNLVISGAAQGSGQVRVAQIILDTSGTALVNHPYSANSEASDLAGSVSLTQSSLSTTSASTPSVWVSTGGTITVESIAGKTYKLRLTDVTMGTGSGNDSASTGSFTLNGTATVTVP